MASEYLQDSTLESWAQREGGDPSSDEPADGDRVLSQRELGAVNLQKLFSQGEGLELEDGTRENRDIDSYVELTSKAPVWFSVALIIMKYFVLAFNNQFWSDMLVMSG